MPKNSRKAIIVNGVEYRSMGAAEVALRMSTALISKKIKCQKLPYTFTYKNKDFTVERPAGE